jgi:hypothetical protein
MLESLKDRPLLVRIDTRVTSWIRIELCVNREDIFANNLRPTASIHTTASAGSASC